MLALSEDALWPPWRSSILSEGVMDKAPRDMWDYSVANIDDILVFSPTWDTHLQHLSSVFEAIRKAGLTTNRKKSNLGHTLV